MHYKPRMIAQQSGRKTVGGRIRAGIIEIDRLTEIRAAFDMQQVFQIKQPVFTVKYLCVKADIKLVND